MSLDYYCYVSSKCIVTPTAIQERARKWRFLFLDEKKRPLLDAKPVPSYCLIWGWKPSKVLNGVEEKIKENEQAELTKLAKKNMLGGCSLSEDATFRADPDEMVFPENKRQSKLLLSAIRRFETNTAHQQNNLSWELQQVICESIAKIDGGLLEEPQMGEFKSVSAKKS